MADWAACARCNKDIEKSGAVQEGESYFCNSVCAAANKMNKSERKRAWKPAEWQKDAPPVERAQGAGANLGCIYVAVILGGLILATCVQGMREGPGPSVDSAPRQQQKEWNEGGTLHSSDDSEWLAASYENRLATAADYVATLHTFSNMDQMRAAAERMESCVTDAAKARAGQKSSALAAVCNELLK